MNKYSVSVYSGDSHHHTWAVNAAEGDGVKLVCVCVYKRGAEEVAKILNTYESALAVAREITEVARITKGVGE